jgi:outer membrane lipoprotein-sorting protein
VHIALDALARDEREGCYGLHGRSALGLEKECTHSADGNVVAIRDNRLGTQDVYSIGLTPLKFLLRDTINVENDAKIIDVKVAGERVIINLEDSSTFGGTSRISLGFDRQTMLLKQWTVTDPQGYDVSILLTAINLDDVPEPLLFVVPEKPGTAKTR